MTVTDQTRPPVRELQGRSLGQEGLNLQVHCLGQELAGPSPQHLRQGIIDVIRLTKPHDIAILIHGGREAVEEFTEIKSIIFHQGPRQNWWAASKLTD